MGFIINIIGIWLGYHWFGPWFTVPLVMVIFRFTSRSIKFKLGE